MARTEVVDEKRPGEIDWDFHEGNPAVALLLGLEIISQAYADELLTLNYAMFLLKNPPHPLCFPRDGRNGRRKKQGLS